MHDQADDTTRRIVVGVDGSHGSQVALRWAMVQAHLTGATVEAVATWQDPMLYGYTYGWVPATYEGDSIATITAKVLDAAIAEVSATMEHPATVLPRVVEGHAAQVLPRRAPIRPRRRRPERTGAAHPRPRRAGGRSARWGGRLQASRGAGRPVEEAGVPGGQLIGAWGSGVSGGLPGRVEIPGGRLLTLRARCSGSGVITVRVRGGRFENTAQWECDGRWRLSGFVFPPGPGFDEPAPYATDIDGPPGTVTSWDLEAYEFQWSASPSPAGS